MTEGDWIKVIREIPDDDAPRLQFSDWLIEQGQDIRARFVQIQVELANSPLCPFGGADRSTCRSPDNVRCAVCLQKQWLKDAEREFIIEYGIDLLAGFELICKLISPPQFHRGFIEVIGIPAEEWIPHGDTIYAATPLREVQLTTTPKVQHRVFDGSGPMAFIKGVGEYQPAHESVADIARELFSRRWPGVRFTLPPQGSAEDGRRIRNTNDGVVMPVTNPFHTARR